MPKALLAEAVVAEVGVAAVVAVVGVVRLGVVLLAVGEGRPRVARVPLLAATGDRSRGV